MGSQSLPFPANRNSLKSLAKWFSSGKPLPRRTAKPALEKLEDRLALAPIVTPHYVIPNFGENPTIFSDSSGAWSNPDTWSAGRVPTANDIVAISASTTVTYDVASSPALDTVVIYAGALLNFRTDMSTQLIVTHFQVLEGGELRIGTAANPVAASVTAQVVIRNVALDPIRDPSQFGNGLIGLGKVTMHGANKVSAVRLAAEPLAGQTTLSLSQAATGWRVGDKLVIPDSRQSYGDRWEEATIAAISTDGLTITLAAPLQFNHLGARDGDGVLEFLPHVANRTRNIVVRSESSSGTRGYVLFTGRADVDVRYAAFIGTGRTKLGTMDASNPADRHPVTFAHLYGPAGGQPNGHAYTFVGNAVVCGLPTHEVKWGIAIRDSHYGLIQGNVLYNWAGSALATITGNESYNVIDGNYAIRGRGKGDREGLYNWTSPVQFNPGDEGMGFWFGGTNNYVRNNVAANFASLTNGEAAYGYKYRVLLGNVHIPNFVSADTTVAGQYSMGNLRATPILEFAGNEVYGMENGLAIWALNVESTNPAVSVFKDFRCWHVLGYGMYGYPMANVTFDGWVQRGDWSFLSNVNNNQVGIWFGDYTVLNQLVIRNADIQGVRHGIIDPYSGGCDTLIEDSYFRNTFNITVESLRAPGAGFPTGQAQPKKLTIRNVQYGDVTPFLGGLASANILMWYRTDESKTDLTVKDEVFVENYNGTGINYQVYYAQQTAGFIMPQSNSWVLASPVAGLTNQQNWDQYGIATAGAVAPADATTVAGIQGLATTYVVPPDTTDPSTPTGLTATAVSSSQINLAWAASSDNVRVVGYRIYRNGVQVGASSTNSFFSTGLSPSTNYTFTVVAYDPAGNVSAHSAPASATTLSPPPLPPSRIIDNGAAGSRVSGSWARKSGPGFQHDIHSTAKGNGARQATWTFTGLSSGQYNVWATWSASSKNATNAPFSVHKGSGFAPVVRVNQRVAPKATAEGAKWRFLMTITVTNGWAMVKLTNKANGVVVADAIRLVEVPPAAPSTAALLAHATAPASSVSSPLVLASGGNLHDGDLHMSLPLPKPAAEPQPTSSASHAAHDQVLSGNEDVRPENALLEETVNLLSSVRGTTSDESSSLALDQLLASSAI